MEIYPVDSIIHLSNNSAQQYTDRVVAKCQLLAKLASLVRGYHRLDFDQWSVWNRGKHPYSPHCWQRRRHAAFFLLPPFSFQPEGNFLSYNPGLWFNFILDSNFFFLLLGMVMYDNNMIMSLKQRKRKFKPRIKLNHYIYTGFY